MLLFGHAPRIWTMIATRQLRLFCLRVVLPERDHEPSPTGLEFLGRSFDNLTDSTGASRY